MGVPELLHLLNGILTVGLLVLGWFARELWSAVKALKDDLLKLKDTLAEHYVRKDDFRDFKADLFAVLTRIESKLDHKQDK
jgi:hypothetical protein